MLYLRKFLSDTDLNTWISDKTKKLSSFVFLNKLTESLHYSGNGKNASTQVMDAVDLGLPSGTLWMTCNIGASKPEEFGLYSQYCCAEGYTDVDEIKQHSYTTTSPFNINPDIAYLDENNEIKPEYDIAYAVTHGTAKMPTKEQADELKNNTTYEWTTLNDVEGVLLKSKINNETLFLPAAGYYYDGRLNTGAKNAMIQLSTSKDGSNVYVLNYYLSNGSTTPGVQLWYSGNRSARTVRGVLI